MGDGRSTHSVILSGLFLSAVQTHGTVVKYSMSLVRSTCFIRNCVLPAREHSIVCSWLKCRGLVCGCGIVWNCVALFDIVWHRMGLCGIVGYCGILHGIVQHRVELCRILWCCGVWGHMELHGTVVYCVVLHGIV